MEWLLLWVSSANIILFLYFSLWQRIFQKYQQNHYQKYPQKNLVCVFGHWVLLSIFDYKIYDK